MFLLGAFVGAFIALGTLAIIANGDDEDDE